MRSAHVLILAGLVTLSRMSLPGAEIVVDFQGTADFTSIQPAIDASRDGDTVLVRPGTYRIDAPITIRQKGITLRASGPREETVILLQAPSDPGRASVVVFEGPSRSPTRLEGFVITGGRGIGEVNFQQGGGIHCSGGAAPTIIDCSLRDNEARIGGAIFCLASDPTLIRCDIRQNSAVFHAGVVIAGASLATLEDCLIMHNRASLEGGGICSVGGATTRLSRCSLFENIAQRGGGVYLSGGGRAILEDSRITQNVVSFIGSAILCDEASQFTLINCLVAGNAAVDRVGAIYVGATSRAEIYHSTIARNRGGTEAPALYVAQSELVMTGSIVWDHAGPSLVAGGGPDPQVSRSCIQGGWPGEGNIVADPRFAGPFDFQLTLGSPAIDAALLEGAPAGDILGQPRPCGDAPDLGAFEFCPLPEKLFRRGDANADASEEVSDAAFILNYLFIDGPALPCADAADANDDGDVDLGDALAIFGFLFLGEPPFLPPPLLACGHDPTPDLLECAFDSTCRE